MYKFFVMKTTFKDGDYLDEIITEQKSDLTLEEALVCMLQYIRDNPGGHITTMASAGLIDYESEDCVYDAVIDIE